MALILNHRITNLQTSGCLRDLIRKSLCNLIPRAEGLPQGQARFDSLPNLDSCAEVTVLPAGTA